VFCPALGLLGLLAAAGAGVVALARRPPRVRESHH
jgi:hypothetical protein